MEKEMVFFDADAATEEFIMDEDIDLEEVEMFYEPEQPVSEPTQQEINDALCYHLKDYLPTMSDAQKSYIKELVDEALAGGTAKERLYNEIIDLQTKIQKLEDFMRKRNLDGIRLTQELGLTEAALHLMSKQLELEKELNDILVARYSIFDVKKS